MHSTPRCSKQLRALFLLRLMNEPATKEQLHTLHEAAGYVPTSLSQELTYLLSEGFAEVSDQTYTITAMGEKLLGHALTHF